MSQNSSNPTFLFSGFVCRISGHQYRVSKTITKHIKEYQCKVCGKEITNTSTGGLEVLNLKNRTVNRVLASFYKRRNNKKIAL